MVFDAMADAWAGVYAPDTKQIIVTNNRSDISFNRVLDNLRMGPSFLQNRLLHKFQIPYFCRKRKTPVLRQKLISGFWKSTSPQIIYSIILIRWGCSDMHLL
jgi:hypothetical protein